MKKRNDFVSNSSSSSFIIIKSSNIKDYNFNNQEITIPNKDEGDREFGWGWNTYTDFWSKLNFCAIQLDTIRQNTKYLNETLSKPNKTEYDKRWLDGVAHRYKENADKLDDYLDMLQTVCKNNFNLNIELASHDEIEDMFAYIDHQSNVSEGMNMEMFESESNLIDFLASDDSCIKTGNDNDDPPSDDWYNER